MRRAIVPLVLLLSSTPAFGDGSGDTKRAYLAVAKWKGKITMSVDDTASSNLMTSKINGSLNAVFGPLPIERGTSGPDNPVWAAKNVTGTMSVNSTGRDTTPVRSVMTWVGNGAIPADAEVRLGIDFQHNTLEFHLFTGEIAGTLTTEAMGQRATEPSPVSIGGMTRTFPLPATVGRIVLRFKCTFAECHVTGIPADAQKQAIDVSIELEPDTKLTAVPGGPYSVERGQLVNLDGSGSIGEITRYTWVLVPKPCPGASASRKTHDGVGWSVTALCSMSATLTVTDGTKTDRKEVRVEVRARGSFVTQFSEAAEKPLDAPAPLVSATPRGGRLELTQLTVVGGANTCVKDLDPLPLHTIHPPPAGNTWDGGGYKLKLVADDGPFENHWFVETESLELSRQISINKWMLPGGPKPLGRMEPIHARNTASHMDIEGYLTAVRDHEKLHSTKMKKAIERRDPAKKIEPMITSGDRDALRRKVDREISRAELAVCRAAADPMSGDRDKRFKLVFPRDDNDGWVLPEQAIVVGPSGPSQTICE